MGGVFLVLVILALFSFFHLPFQLSNVMYYLLFFFMGYALYGSRTGVIKRINGKRVILAWAIFLLLYAGLNYVRNYCILHLEEGLLLEVVKKGCRLGYTIAGMMAFYLTSVWIVFKIKLPLWYVKMGAMCFGVYVFQQFILQIIYYNSPLVTVVNAYALPWVAFAITLFVSIVLTWVVRLTSFGRRIL